MADEERPRRIISAEVDEKLGELHGLIYQFGADAREAGDYRAHEVSSYIHDLLCVTRLELNGEVPRPRAAYSQRPCFIPTAPAGASYVESAVLDRLASAGSMASGNNVHLRLGGLGVTVEAYSRGKVFQRTVSYLDIATARENILLMVVEDAIAGRRA